MRFARVWACLLSACWRAVKWGPSRPRRRMIPLRAHGSYETAQAGRRSWAAALQRELSAGTGEAERENKPMLLFFTAQWCQYCHQMAGEAFTDPQVVNLSEKFVCVLVDADSAAESLPSSSTLRQYPTVQFVSPQGMALNRIEGKRPGHQVMMAMQAALQTAALHNQPSARPCVRGSFDQNRSPAPEFSRVGKPFSGSRGRGTRSVSASRWCGICLARSSDRQPIEHPAQQHGHNRCEEAPHRQERMPVEEIRQGEQHGDQHAAQQVPRRFPPESNRPIANGTQMISRYASRQASRGASAKPGKSPTL